MRTVVVSDTFDDVRSSHVRFLQEASKLGEVHVVLWPDRDIQAATGRPPKFPQGERLYLLQAIRYVQGSRCPPAWMTRTPYLSSRV